MWLFRERLVEAKAIDALFARAVLEDRGYLAMGGQIIDASVAPAPGQRNTEEERPRSRKAVLLGVSLRWEPPCPAEAAR